MNNSEDTNRFIQELEKRAKNIEKSAYDLIYKAPLEYFSILKQYDWDILPIELINLQNTILTSYRSWYYSVLELIKQFLPDEIRRFEECYENKSGKGYEYGVIDILHFKVEVYNRDRRDVIKKFQNKFHVQVGLLSSLKPLDIKEFKRNVLDIKTPIFQKIENLWLRFHEVALILRNRVSRPSRPGFKIEDEYDVQDLLHALLLIEFEDVRPEEYVPSYASNNSRIDFFLKNEKILIETKMTRKTLKDKKLTEDLILDIQYYQKHPECKVLYCLIYDPDDLIQNRSAIINDLSKDEKKYIIKILFSPRRS